jgi:DNA-binding NtrC family response regulator
LDGDQYAVAVDERERLLGGVNGVLDTIRDQLIAHLGDQTERAWRLGRTVGKAVYPPDIYRHLDQPPRVENNVDPKSGDIGQPSPPARTLGELVSRPRDASRKLNPAMNARQRPQRVWSTLAPYPYEPGSRAPDEGWCMDVRQLWAELRLGDSLPDSFVNAERRGQWEAPDELRRVFNDLVLAARERLRRLAAAQSATTPTTLPATPAAAAALAPSAGGGESRERRVPSAEDLSPSEKKAMYDELLRKKQAMDPAGKYIGESLPILQVFDTIVKLNKKSHKPILILGPSGVGKTTIAELIHRSSSRKDWPFYPTQASTSTHGVDKRIPLATWLGHVKDSGIAALDPKGAKGLLQTCDKGSIFLDELVEVDPDFQTFLLQVLDKALLSPVGAKDLAQFKPDVRLIFATNADPEEAVDEGKLRHDLLRRIGNRRIIIPSLRSRRSDIILFARSACPEGPLDAKVLLALIRYSWPGEVGELMDVLEAATEGEGDQKKLLLDRIEFAVNQEIVEDVRRTEDSEAEDWVFQLLESALREQGLEKRKGLHKRMAELLRVSKATISRIAKRVHPDDPSQDG